MVRERNGGARLVENLLRVKIIDAFQLGLFFERLLVIAGVSPAGVHLLPLLPDDEEFPGRGHANKRTSGRRVGTGDRELGVDWLIVLILVVLQRYCLSMVGVTSGNFLL